MKRTVKTWQGRGIGRGKKAVRGSQDACREDREAHMMAEIEGEERCQPGTQGLEQSKDETEGLVTTFLSLGSS